MDRNEPASVDARAAAWVIREDGGPLSEADRAERDRWLAVSPRHFGAYARARAVLTWSGRMAAPGPRAAVGHRRRWRLPLAAAAMALLVVAVTLFQSWPSGALHRTDRGQILRIALQDGSTLTLDADTRVRVRYFEDRRELTLLAGTALFDVAHDPGRPFTVEAAGAKVIAIGTRFSVSVDRLRGTAGPIEVLVSEGVVDVAEADPNAVPVRLQAGMRALARPAAGVEVGQVEDQELDRRLMWREGMLAFNGDTLSVAAARFRHYSDVPIIIEDPSVGSRRVVGLYPASDPEGFARNVALSLGLDVERRDEGIRLFVPTPSAPPPPTTLQ